MSVYDSGNGATEYPEAEAIVVPINGELDLHNFHPREARDLVNHYLEECVLRGIKTVRIVHGKGSGQLKAKVRSVLDKHPRVARYQQAGPGGGNWGATLVELNAPGSVEAGNMEEGEK
ncbi:MAG: DNA mismatch repair protein MutS [Rickettsiales bacterium]|nr:DNA mismatch repair protein MutS [Rickettsiales bacterium]|tara:strand:- start:768 stop:1121 length:354 start_codon:yes stop_codon:yes gene_type:complete